MQVATFTPLLKSLLPSREEKSTMAINVASGEWTQGQWLWPDFLSSCSAAAKFAPVNAEIFIFVLCCSWSIKKLICYANSPWLHFRLPKLLTFIFSRVTVSRVAFNSILRLEKLYTFSSFSSMISFFLIFRFILFHILEGKFLMNYEYINFVHC